MDLNNDFINQIEKTRNRLLDLTRKNKMINFPKEKESGAYFISVVDESPDFLFDYLYNKNKKMKVISIPYITEDDISFCQKNNLFNDSEINNKPIEELEPLDKIKNKINIKNWAKNNNIETSFDIHSYLNHKNLNKHIDNKIQTLCYQNQMNAILEKLLKQYSFYNEEKGVHSLFISLGALNWKDGQQKEYNSPLILLPINIERERKSSGFEYYVNYNDFDIMFNTALKEKLRFEYNINLREFDEKNEEIEEYFNYINNKIINKFSNWSVKRYINILVYDPQKILMYTDLEPSLWENNSFLNNPLIQRAIDPNYKYVDSNSEENSKNKNSINSVDLDKKYPIVFPADLSQHQAVIKANHGSNLAIQGPPGTGKSQTIANIISNLLFEGKKVLFVSEKAAALNVVKNKMKEVGLEEICLDLHGENLNKKKFIISIKKRLDNYQKQYDTQQIFDYYNNIETGFNFINSYYKKINQEIEQIGLSYREIINIINYYDKKFNNLISENALKEINFSINHTNMEKIYRYIFLIVEAEKNSKQYNVVKNLNHSLLNKIGKTQIYENELSDLIEFLNFIIKNIFNIQEKIKTLYSKDIPLDVLSIIKICDQLLEIDKNNIDYTSLNFNTLENETESMIQLSSILEEKHVKKDYIVYNQKEFNLISENTLKSLNPKISLKDNIISLKYIQKHFNNIKAINDFIKKINHHLNKDFSINDINDFLKFKHLFNYSLNIDNIDLIYYKNNFPLTTYHENIKNIKYKISILEKNLKNIEIQKNHKEIIYDIENINTIEISISEIKNANFIKKIFSNNYKKRLNYLLNTINVNKNENIDFIAKSEYYLDFLKKYKEFLDNKEFKKFDILFDGFETRFEDIDILYQWLKNIAHSPYKDITTFDSEILVDAIKHIKENIDILEFQLKNFNNLENVFSHLKSQKLEMENIKKLDYFYNEEIIAENLILFHNSILSNVKKIEPNYNIENFYEDIKTAQSIYKLMGNIPVQDIISFYLKNKKEIPSINKQHSLIIEKINDYKNTKNNKDFLPFIEETLKCSPNDLNNKNHTLNSEKIILEQFNKFHYNLNQLKIQYNGIDKITEYFIENNIHEPDDMKNICIGIIFKQKIKNAIEKIEELKSFDSVQYDFYIKSIKEGLNNIRKLNAYRILEKTNQMEVPTGIKSNHKKECTGLYLLENETKKMRNHYPIRFIVEKSWDTILELKPCFMMSPTSVSEYLPKKDKLFDVLIIDEASQMYCENAIPAIARSKQIIIVGDNKQLPPVEHFSKRNSDENDEDDSEINNSESILELSSAIFEKEKNLSLNWHYRSKHPSLISFSNQFFYNNKLKIFPSAKNESYMGIKFNYIENAIYDANRKNILEAQTLIDKFISDIKQYPKFSYGIVSINKTQANLLEELFHNKLIEDEKLHDIYKEKEKSIEPIFIKNLENVQGDERDNIYISFVYGKKEGESKVLQRFGEINKKNGERYLNVLFTRSRLKMEIFSSLKSNDIIAFSNDEKQGKYVLKSFLQYAEFGLKAKAQITGKDPDSLFEEEVIQALEEYGYECEPQVGQAGFRIDISIKDPKNKDNFILGIECDGATYHSDQFTKEKDILKQNVLENMGWKIHRIWSTDWFKNRDIEIDKVLKILNSLTT